MIQLANHPGYEFFESGMLSKKGYLIHFARLFFASVLFAICSLVSHLWQVNQPLELTFQLHRCQSNLQRSPSNLWNWLNQFHFIHLFPSLSFHRTKCHSSVKDNYTLNINQLMDVIHCSVLVYFAYHLIRLSLFHARLSRLQGKQNHYARLYRHDQRSRCSKRLF